MKNKRVILLLVSLVFTLVPDANTRKEYVLSFRQQTECEFSNSAPKKQPLAEPLYANTTCEAGKDEHKLFAISGIGCSSGNTKHKTRIRNLYHTPHRKIYLLPQHLDLPPPICS